MPAARHSRAEGGWPWLWPAAIALSWIGFGLGYLTAGRDTPMESLGSELTADHPRARVVSSALRKLLRVRFDVDPAPGSSREGIEMLLGEPGGSRSGALTLRERSGVRFGVLTLWEPPERARALHDRVEKLVEELLPLPPGPHGERLYPCAPEVLHRLALFSIPASSRDSAKEAQTHVPIASWEMGRSGASALVLRAVPGSEGRGRMMILVVVRGLGANRAASIGALAADLISVGRSGGERTLPPVFPAQPDMPFRSERPLTTGDEHLLEAVRGVDSGRGMRVSGLEGRLVAVVYGRGPDEAAVILQSVPEGIVLRASLSRAGRDFGWMSRLREAGLSRSPVSSSAEGTLVWSGRLGSKAWDPTVGQVIELLEAAFEWRPAGCC